MDQTALILFSSLAELEKAAWGVGPGDAMRLRFVGGACTVADAAKIYRVLEEGRWEVDEASRALLRRAARHADQVDGLETSLELLAIDLGSKAPVSKACLDAVRTAANAVVITAHESDFRGLLDEVVIDAQRVGRLCRGLRFGADEVAAVDLSADDLEWLMAGGHGVLAGGEPLVLAGGLGGNPLPDLHGSHLCAYGDGGEPLRNDNRFAVLEGLGDVGDADFDALEDGVHGDDVGEPLHLAALFHGDKALSGKVAEPLDDSGKEGRLLLDLVEVKEDTVVELLQQKISKLLDGIKTAKDRIVLD